MLIERYVFRQLLWPTVFAIVALTVVAILSQSLSALNVLVDQRHPLVFLELTLLLTPLAISMILPIGVLVAGLISLNRLYAEQELVICFAGGVSRWRLVAPALSMAAAVTVIGLIINLWIQPICYRTMRETIANLSADSVTNMIRPGEFAHPAPGLTIYVQRISDDGDISNVFVYERGTARIGSSVLTAQQGRVALRNGSPVLILYRGSNQQFNRQGVLTFLSFDEYVFDLRPFMPIASAVRYRLSDRYIHELFFPNPGDHPSPREQRLLWQEANSRLSAPLYNLAFMALALWAIMGATFNRFGYSSRIAMAAVIALVLRVVGFGIQSAAADQAWLNYAQYAVPLGALAITLYGVFAARLPAPKAAPALLRPAAA